MDALPPGETILWEGAPDWRSLARRLCHIKGVALYVALVAAGAATASALEGDTPTQVALTAAPLLAGGALVLAFLTAMAWLVARTTSYTITTTRLFIRFGIALPVTLGIPHAGIARASVALHPDGTGDLPIETKPGYHVAWRRCWPHARPWHLLHPQPMLRSVPEAGRVATLLAQALSRSGSISGPSAAGETARPRQVPNCREPVSAGQGGLTPPGASGA